VFQLFSYSSLENKPSIDTILSPKRENTAKREKREKTAKREKRQNTATLMCSLPEYQQ
jgi:hypothetical protein